MYKLEQIVHYKSGKFLFDVRIMEIKRAYGRTRYKICPVSGKGTAWVEKILTKGKK